MKFQLFILIFLVFGHLACSIQYKTFIVTGDNESVSVAAGDLARYLSATYPRQKFEVVSQPVSEGRNILLKIVEDGGLENNEAYKILGEENQLIIKGKTPRAVAYGVYGLLKHLGWNFHLSFQVPPDNPKPLDFPSVNLENEPLKERRILLNWHNFISGCTGWDYKHWEEWIDNGLKIGFNTVMVHAYGNNPMHSFSFNGLDKDLGYLTTTQRGRDWGAQHVNDVRLLHGGDIFTHYEFGSEAAKVPVEDRVQSATGLMQEVFRHASMKNMDICFALDVDTWIANPQNIITTLPDDALIEILGYQTVNPDHVEGRKYYTAQLKKLFHDYPEINILAAWMRNPRQGPGLGSTWLQHSSNTLPESWQKEYFKILENHPELKDERPYPGLFAISKIIKVYREILDEINPEVELMLGSWRMEYPKLAKYFIPEFCGFIPLNSQIYDDSLDNSDVMDELSKVGENRNIYPVVWAHHDDHRYIGRPYIPYSNFNSMLNRINSNGYGIIHWTTHPLDLFFTNYENQVWKNTENETFDQTIFNFASSLLRRDDSSLHLYFSQWFNEAPMFGRETSDDFLPLNKEYDLDGYESSEEVIKKAEQRLALLNRVDVKALNKSGQREYRYQLGIEKFIISLFTCHQYGHAAYIALQQGNREEAVALVEKIRPVETVQIFAGTIREYGPTRGEEGLLISLNLRWLPDYIDLKQRVGLEPVRANFQPTSHDPLAQGMGTNTFFVDESSDFWLSLGEKELDIVAEASGNLPMKKVTESWLVVDRNDSIPIKTMRGYNLPADEYSIRLIFAEESPNCKVEIIEQGKPVSAFSVSGTDETVSVRFKTGGDGIKIRLIPEEGVVKFAGLILECI